MQKMTLVALALLASPLSAQTTPAPGSNEPPVVVTGKKVCRWETPIGSNMRHRICMTVAEEKSRARENERRTERYIHDKANMSARTKTCPNNC